MNRNARRARRRGFTMIEFILATAILVGKADIAPDKVQYEFLHEDGTITSVVRTVYPTK